MQAGNLYTKMSMVQRQLQGWIPEEILCIALPLDKKFQSSSYEINYREGTDIGMVSKICETYLKPTCMKYGLPRVPIYMYCMNYSHNFTGELDRVNCNNGYTQKIGNHYSIVIFRRFLWPKVLIHEILHILWMSAGFPSYQGIQPKQDEIEIEGWALCLSINEGYISQEQYLHYRRSACKAIVHNVMGGAINGDFAKECLKKQKTPIYEYFFLTKLPFETKKVKFLDSI